MADTTALKNRIRAAIKANDNQEITGPVLQQTLLDMVDELNGATETEAGARQNGDSTLQQGINTEREARIEADSALGQRITEEIHRAQEVESTIGGKASKALSEITNLELEDVTGTSAQTTELSIALRTNEGSEQEPDILTLDTITLPSTSDEKTGLLSVQNKKAFFKSLNRWFIGTNEQVENDKAMSMLLNVVEDIWFTNVASAFDNSDYYIKLGIVSFNANTLDSITDMFAAAYLSEGTITELYFSGHASIQNPKEVQILEFNAGGAGTMYMKVNLSKLDFSAFPASPVAQYGYLVINQNQVRNNLLVQKKKTNLEETRINDAVNVEKTRAEEAEQSITSRVDDNEKKVYKPWLNTSFTESKETTRAIIDAWVTDITDVESSGNGSWYDSTYDLKIGFFGFDTRSLETATRFWLFLFYTNGTEYETWNFGQNAIENKNGINLFEGTFQTFTGSLKFHILIDFSMLDFSKISSTTTGGYYKFIDNGPASSNNILNKKKTSRYNYLNIPGFTQELKNKSLLLPTSKAVSLFIKSNPNKWFIGSETEIASRGASANSLLAAIVDVWWEPNDTWTNKFNSDSYYLKLGIVGIGANSLNSIDFVYITGYLTNGDDLAYFGKKAFISDPTKIQHIVSIGDNPSGGKIHYILDLTKLDFSTFPASPYRGFGYLVVNDGKGNSGFLASKKISSEYGLSVENQLQIQENQLQIQENNKLILQNRLYKINYYDTILCAGDSVTKGYIVEGTQEHPQTIYEEMPSKSYPAALGKIVPKADITVKAQSGITPIGWLSTFFPTLNFADYEMIILELGLNGGLNIDDINTEGTNTYAYRQIVQGMRQQNSKGVIVLVRSSHFITNAITVINSVANEFGCLVVDLQSQESKDIINLDSQEMHGYYDNSGTPAVDWAHFTRKGYNAKAYVISRMIEARLSNVTDY